MAQINISKYYYAINFELSFTTLSQNIANNTSQVRVLGRIYGHGNNEKWTGTTTGKVVFNGSEYSFSMAPYNWPNATAINITVFDQTFTVAHGSDGKKTVTGSMVWNHGVTWFNTASVSETVTLATIPRTSSFTLGGATQTNSDISVTISRASTAFTHKVRYKVGSGSWIDIASSATTSASFKVQPSNMANLKTATITVGVQTYSGTTAIGSEATATRTITIPNTTISLSGTANTGSVQTVSISNSGGSLTHTISWSLGSATGGNSSTWTPPHSALPSATSGTLTCTVTTKNGTATINSTSATRTITVPTSVLPTFTAITHSEYVSDVNTKVGAYVQGKTRLTLGVTSPVAGSGSSIKSYAISVAGQTVSNGGTTPNVISQSGTLTITATITDNRNRTATKTTTITVLAYENPSITGVSFTRSNSNGTPNTTGTYLTIKATVKVRRLVVGGVEKNKINYQSESGQVGYDYTIKTNLASQAGTVSGNYLQSVYTHTFDTTNPTHGGYSVDYPYNVRVRGGDIFSWTGYMAGSIPTGVVLQHWGEDTTSFGKMIDDTSYNVLVGSKGMKVDGTLNVGGSTEVSTSGSAKKKFGWGGLYTGSSSNIGVIRINVGTENTMFNAKISLRSYNYLADIVVGGYTYTASSNWHMPQATGLVHGGTLNVRFSTSGGNRYIQIGDSNTDWSGYLHVTVDEVSFGYGTFSSPFNVSLETSYIGTTDSTQNVGGSGSVSWSSITGKPSTFAPSSHTHAWSQVTGQPAQATRWPTWAEVSGKPSTFTSITALYSGSVGANGSATMSSMSGYTFLVVVMNLAPSVAVSRDTMVIPVANISYSTSGDHYSRISWGSQLNYGNFSFGSATNIRVGAARDFSIKTIYGVK